MLAKYLLKEQPLLSARYDKPRASGMHRREEGSLAQCNPVIIVYRREMGWTDRMLQRFGAGEFTHCELYFPLLKVTFAVFIPGSMRCDTSLCKLYVHPRSRHKFAWHLLHLNQDEYDALLNWNVAIKEHHCGYNLADLVWQAVPMAVQDAVAHDLSEKEGRMPRRVFCSQAVVLGMREACRVSGSSTRLRTFTNSMNSRLTTPTDLACHMTQYLGVGVNTSCVPLTGEDVQAYLQAGHTAPQTAAS